MMRSLLIVVLFTLPATSQNPAVTASAGLNGAAQITLANGKRATISKEPGQTGIGEIRIASDGTVGWLVELAATPGGNSSKHQTIGPVHRPKQRTGSSDGLKRPSLKCPRRRARKTPILINSVQRVFQQHRKFMQHREHTGPSGDCTNRAIPLNGMVRRLCCTVAGT